jgi:hypothetical protein
MANDFSTDPRCQALWRFENDLTDSQGGNHLTDVNPVAFTAADKKEGSYAADFEKDNSEYAYRPDANLDAGFPFKNGDAAKKIAVCFWIKPESYQYPGYIFAKFDTAGNRRSFAVARYGARIRVYSGYNGGASNEYFEADLFMSNNEWYHIGVSFDGLNKAGVIRLFRASNETTYSWPFNFVNETHVADADLTAASRHGGGNYYDGLLDELVVFNDLISVEEIDAIRRGEYTGPLPGYVKADALGTLVAYSLTPDVGYVQADALGVLAAYGVKPPGGRVFPVPHPKTRWQSHYGKRKFPVVN